MQTYQLDNSIKSRATNNYCLPKSINKLIYQIYLQI